MTPSIRQRMIETCRRMAQAGLNQGTSGNLSVRDGDGLLITPSGVPYDRMTAHDIVRLDAEARPDPDAHCRPSSEWRLHHDILARRPKAGAVLHAHPTHCIAISIMRSTIPPIHYMIVCAGGRDIRVAPYATFGTQALSDAAVAALEGRTACLLAHHGMVALAADPEAALALAIEVEALARQYVACLSIGEPPLLTDAALDDAIARFAEGYGQRPS